MQRIRLKEKSPEFIESETKIDSRFCDENGCNASGECRAPKGRDLNEYHYFCQEHAREYNKKWNYFDGMSEEEVEDHIYNQTIWDRPTWNFADQSKMEDFLRKKVRREFFDEDIKARREHYDQKYREEVFRKSGTPEAEALAIMDLSPPVTLESLKIKYKELVKKHHPDVNGGSKEAEEHFKKINMAYTILKVAYENFDKIKEKHEF